MKNDFEKMLWLSSVPLISINNEREPIGMASGCFLRYKTKKILLSVQHATGNGEAWGIQQQFIPNRGTEIYSLGAMHFLKEINIHTLDSRDVDFSYVKIPEYTLAKRQNINPDTHEVNEEFEISTFHSTLEDEPSVEMKYGFCGLVQPSREGYLLHAQPRIYTELTYLRTENNYCYFRLPFEHPGHEHFQGCSGAPIIGLDGNVIALVCGGNIETNELYGISLKAYRSVIDILIEEDIGYLDEC